MRPVLSQTTPVMTITVQEKIYYSIPFLRSTEVAKAKRAQLVCAAHGTRETTLDGAAKIRRYRHATVLTLN